MKKSNAATKLSPKSAPARAKTLTRGAAAQKRAAEEAQRVEAQRAKWREAYYARTDRTVRKGKRGAPVVATPVASTPAPVAAPTRAPVVAITKSQLVSTLEVQIIAARASAPTDSAMLAALETSLRLARLLAD
jgi:hypothetical protein